MWLIMQLSNDHPSYKTKTGTGRRRKLQHLCLDKAYNSESEEQELIKRGYVLHIPSKRKKVKKKNKRPRLQYNIGQIGKSILQKDGL